ncbi:MAG: hypothetical protein ACRESO_03805, partial [Gammaproteobacteria bacterium]
LRLRRPQRLEQSSGVPAQVSCCFEVDTMNTCSTTHEKDLLGFNWITWLLWIAPWGLIVVSGYGGELIRTVVWTFSFTVMGAACTFNARRCDRLHCFYTAPLFFLAALASLLGGLHILPLGRDGWNWIFYVAVVGSLFACFALERLSGKYVKAKFH